MTKPVIGVNLFPTEQMRDLKQFERTLQRVVECGLDAVELPLHGMDAIHNGVLNRKRVQQYVNVLEQFDLKITAHAPYDLNLFREQDLRTEIAVFESSIEMSAILGASVMTYHPARFVGEEQFYYPHTWTRWEDQSKREAKAFEREIILKMAELARQGNVKIGMENIRPYPDCPDFCYSISLDELHEQVALIDHPNVGITLDVGHLHLSANFLHVDVCEEVKRAKDKIIHLHLHDNFGKVCYSSEKNQFQLVTFGRGDMHMPIGTGNVPLLLILESIIANYQGVWLHEIRERYLSDMPNFVSKTNDLLNNLRQPILNGVHR